MAPARAPGAMRLLAGLSVLATVRAEPPYARLPEEPSPTAPYKLLDGREMPMFGLGVYLSKVGGQTYDAVTWALQAGYRLIDTAEVYGNEADVGRAVRDSGIPREEIWVTSKLRPGSHGYEAALEAGRKSNEDLGLGYMDLFLIHAPHGGKLIETWDAMLQLQREGITRSVGVSNYNVMHIRALREHGRPMPAVNQFEMHPLVYKARQPLLEYCKEQGILVQAYGSVFFGRQEKLADGTVAEVAAAHPGKTPAQVLLRWGVQMGFQIIPKSVRQTRIKENMEIFDFSLSEDEMAKLSGMKGVETTESALGYWNPLDSPLDLGRTDMAPKQPQGEL